MDEEFDVGTRRARVTHRLCDLEGRDRVVAITLVVALLVPLLISFAMTVPDWAPAADPAFMGLRALDVGTTLTPLVGQPSTSAEYIPGLSVHHLGALHFYLLAVPIRLFGGSIGMPLVSVAIVGTSVLLTLWAVFRQLGRAAAMVAGVVLSVTMFTTGAWSLVNPVSSSIAGYPLLCSGVLLWCVLCGDLRLLPLTTAVVSFTVQQHLSVGPAIAFLTAAGLIGLAVTVARDGRLWDTKARRELIRSAAWSVLVGFVVWAPALLDQVAGEGNLGRLFDYTRADRDGLGLTSAVYQVVHTMGLPPLLGRTDFSGVWLQSTPSVLTWTSAVAVGLAVLGLAIRWRRSDPRKARLTVMVAVTAAAGITNGASVPKGFEQFRPAFFHWAFVLSFFTALVLVLGAIDLVRGSTLLVPAWVAPLLTCLALVVMVVPSLVNPALDRESNTFGPVHRFWKKQHIDELRDAILRHDGELGHHTLLLGGAQFAGLGDAVAFALAEEGFDVLHPRTVAGFVHDDRLVRRPTVDSAMVLVPITRRGRGPVPPGGKVIAEVEIDPSADSKQRNYALGYTGFTAYVLDRAQVLAYADPEQL